MKTLFPAYIGVTFPLLVAQTYLLVYGTLLLLRRMRLLKRPYSGMEYSESLHAAIILLGVLLLSSVNASGIFQAAKSYADDSAAAGQPFFLFFIRSFLVVFSFSLVFIFLSAMNLRFLFKGEHKSLSLSVSILFSAVAIGFAVICWFACKEVVDGMTPRYINF